MSPPSAAAPAVPRGRVAPARVPGRPRRVSGPARPAAPPRPARSARPAAAPRQTAQGGLVLGVLELVGRLADHRLLDRLIRGRAWIALVAFALIGIVTLQLALLELNAHIGRALVRSGQLQRANTALSIESSEMAAGDRVESAAARLGMELVPEGDLRFLTSNPNADIAKAAAALGRPIHSEAAATAATAEDSGEAGAGEAAAAATSGGEASAQTSGETDAQGTAEAANEAAGTQASPQTGEAASAPGTTGTTPAAGTATGATGAAGAATTGGEASTSAGATGGAG